LAKQKSATSLASIFRIALISGAFVGFVIWGAVREWNRVFIFAGSTVVVVFLGFIILNWLAKPDPDIKPGSPRL
jgi:type IV secretory pathway TrbD component